MSAHTQARKRHSLGRSFLHIEEARIGIPWYMSQRWSEQKAVTALRIKKLEERAHVRRLEKQDQAREKEPSFISRILGK